MTTEEILERLHCVEGDGIQFMARCPAHNDKRPSLSIKKVEDKTLLHCFAGCETEDILNSIGLQMKDLYKN